MKYKCVTTVTLVIEAANAESAELLVEEIYKNYSVHLEEEYMGVSARFETGEVTIYLPSLQDGIIRFSDLPSTWQRAFWGKDMVSPDPRGFVSVKILDEQDGIYTVLLNEQFSKYDKQEFGVRQGDIYVRQSK